MSNSHVDKVLSQWGKQRPGVDCEGLGITLLVQDLDRQLTSKSSRALRRLGLALFEYDVLLALRRQGPPYSLGASELARETHLSSGAMTNRIDRLVGRRLVVRRHSREDRRAVRVALTASGLELADAALEVRTRVADECFGKLRPSQRKKLELLLRRLAG